MMLMWFNVLILLAASEDHYKHIQHIRKHNLHVQYECREDEVFMKIRTPDRFSGKIYPAGSRESSCIQSHENALSPIRYSFPYSDCGTLIEQTDNGSNKYYNKIVIQYHSHGRPKSFSIHCSKNITEDLVRKSVKVGYKVVPILEKNAAAGKINVALYSGDPKDENVVDKIVVGDSMTFVAWTDPGSIYELLIHNCVLRNDKNQHEFILYDQGCFPYPLLMGAFNFSLDQTKVTATVEGVAFDTSPDIVFICNIDLCHRMYGQCDRYDNKKCTYDEEENETEYKEEYKDDEEKENVEHKKNEGKDNDTEIENKEDRKDEEVEKGKDDEIEKEGDRKDEEVEKEKDEEIEKEEERKDEEVEKERGEEVEKEEDRKDEEVEREEGKKVEDLGNDNEEKIDEGEEERDEREEEKDERDEEKDEREEEKEEREEDNEEEKDDGEEKEKEYKELEKGKEEEGKELENNKDVEKDEKEEGNEKDEDKEEEGKEKKEKELEDKEEKEKEVEDKGRNKNEREQDVNRKEKEQEQGNRTHKSIPHIFDYLMKFSDLTDSPL